jgi:hypothetical protein
LVSQQLHQLTQLRSSQVDPQAGSHVRAQLRFDTGSDG